MELQYGDFLKTSNIDNDYDKIFCLNVVYFWDDLKDPFKKVLSLLKTGGAFHIFMADRSTLEKAPDSVFNKYTIEQVVDSLTTAGFAEVENHFEKGFYIKAKK